MNHEDTVYEILNKHNKIVLLRLTASKAALEFTDLEKFSQLPSPHFLKKIIIRLRSDLDLNLIGIRHSNSDHI